MFIKISTFSTTPFLLASTKQRKERYSDFKPSVYEGIFFEGGGGLIRGGCYSKLGIQQLKQQERSE